MQTTLELNQVTGTIFDIQRYSLHDGPGLRTNVFFKGCPLRCGWCANPESQRAQPELALFNGRCLRCGQFSPACPDCPPQFLSAAERQEVFEARIESCPVEAVRWIGQVRSAASIMQEVRRDLPFYAEGGGLTLTGGEPTQQPDLAEALLKLARAEQISTAIETCGYAPWSTFERLLPELDTILFDLKHIEGDRHRIFTGVDNGLILSNLGRLVARQAPVTLRVPLIPGFNATPADLAAMSRFVIETFNGAITQLALLPYHPLGRIKYEALGRDYPWQAYQRLPLAQIEALAAIVRAHGLTVTIGY